MGQPPGKTAMITYLSARSLTTWGSMGAKGFGAPLKLAIVNHADQLLTVAERADHTT